MQFLQMDHCGHKIYLRQFPAGPRKVVPETVLMPKAQQSSRDRHSRPHYFNEEYKESEDCILFLNNLTKLN